MEEKQVKKIKAVILALVQHIAEFVSILCYLIFTGAFLVSFVNSIYKFCFQQGFYADHLVKKALSSFELLFIAPIPILVIYAFRAIMVRIYPVHFKDPEDDTANMLKLDYAKKTFISSIIGVLAIYILSQFFEEGELSYIRVCLSFVFILILILYYFILSSHKD